MAFLDILQVVKVGSWVGGYFSTQGPYFFTHMFFNYSISSSKNGVRILFMSMDLYV